MNIAIASGKGGTGKTLVSTNLFWAAQKEGMPVTLVDCDAEEPNVREFIQGEMYDSISVSQHIPIINTDKCTFCNKCHDYCTYHAIVCIPPSKYIQVVEELCHDCGACIVACEFDAITEKEKTLGRVNSMSLNTHAKIIEARAEVGVYSPVSVIKSAIKTAKGDELCLFDAPPGISCPLIATVENADFVLLVTEPTPFGLNDLKLTVDTLKQLGKPYGVIVNRAELGNKEVYQYLEQKGIPLLMEIPMDREIARIYCEGLLLVDEKPEYQRLFIDLLHRITHLNKIIKK